MRAIEITEERPDTPEGLQLLSELDSDLLRHPYPVESRHAFTVEQLLRQNVRFFVTRCDDQPAGCGGLKIYPAEFAEVKRMYVRPSHRRLGLGNAMLDHLAEVARQHDLQWLRLETGVYQIEAIGLYQRYGFRRRPPFAEYREDPLSAYFEKPV